MTPEQRRIYEDIVASRGSFFKEPFPPLLHQPRICEPTHQLGEFEGVVELTALLGYYTLLALSLNAHELSLPPGVEPPLKPRSALIEVPPPAAGEVQLRVKAIGLNRAEALMRAGTYIESPQLP